MKIWIELSGVFFLCGISGYLLEVLYRSLHAKHLMNPGFLNGCCLPIYGLGGVILFLASHITLPFFSDTVPGTLLLLLIAAGLMTLTELIGGYFFLKVFHVRLWDYSKEWGNLGGLICPRFSLYWFIICVGFHYLVSPHLNRFAAALGDSPVAYFFIGVIWGIFLIDLAISFRLMARLHTYADRLRRVVHLEKLRRTVEEHLHARRARGFLLLRVPGELRNYITRKIEERRADGAANAPAEEIPSPAVETDTALIPALRDGETGDTSKQAACGGAPADTPSGAPHGEEP